MSVRAQIDSEWGKAQKPEVHSAGDRLNGGLHECRSIKPCEGLRWWMVFISTPVGAWWWNSQAQTGGVGGSSMLHTLLGSALEHCFFATFVDVIAHQGVQDIVC